MRNFSKLIFLGFLISHETRASTTSIRPIVAEEVVIFAAGDYENFHNLDPDTLSLRIGLQTPSIEVTVDNDYQLLPNPAPKVGLGADYKYISTYISFLSTDPEEEESRYGKTQYFDFQLHSDFNNMTFDFYYQNFEGYYQENTLSSLIDPIINNDLKTSFIGLNWIYVFRPHRFSYKATYSNLATQKWSGGSPILFVGIGRQSIEDPDGILDSNLVGGDTRAGRLTHGKFTTLHAGLGYAYNLIFLKKAFVSISASAGLGLEHLYYKSDYNSGEEDTLWQPSIQSNARFGMGYMGRKFFMGAQGILESKSHEFGTGQLDLDSVQVFLYAGYRFGV